MFEYDFPRLYSCMIVYWCKKELYVVVFSIQLECFKLLLLVAFYLSTWSHLTRLGTLLFIMMYLCTNFVAVSAVVFVITFVIEYSKKRSFATSIYASLFNSRGIRLRNLVAPPQLTLPLFLILNDASFPNTTLGFLACSGIVWNSASLL